MDTKMTSSENSTLEKELEEISKRMIPRCLTWIGNAKSITFSITNVSNVGKLKASQNGTEFWAVYFFDKNARVEYNVIINDNDVEYDNSIKAAKTWKDVLHEFNTREKMHSMWDALEKMRNVIRFHPNTNDNANLILSATNEKKDEVVVTTSANGPRLPVEETNHVEIRKKAAIEALPIWLSNTLGSPVQLTKTPVIALCFSGGGLRASVGTRFFVNEMEKSGALKTVAYMATLSGSTWFTTDWIWNNILVENAQTPYVSTRDILGSGKISLAAKALSDRWFSAPGADQKREKWSIDMWGGVLGSAYFGPSWNPTETRLSLMGPKLKPDVHPWPLMTAVGDNRVDWFEFSPKHVANVTVGTSQQWARLDAAAFSCQISNGKKKASPPGDDLGQMMAIWGSAPAVKRDEVDKQFPWLLAKPLDLFGLMTGIAYDFPPYSVYSWMPGAPENEKILLRDGGHGFNVPIPPLLEPDRKVDIIVVGDWSANSWDDPTQALVQAAAWCSSKKDLHFPVINLALGKDYWRQPRFLPSVAPGSPHVLFVPLAIKDAPSTWDMTLSADDQQKMYNTVRERWAVASKLLAENVKAAYGTK